MLRVLSICFLFLLGPSSWSMECDSKIPWESLPDELLGLIFTNTSGKELVNFALASKASHAKCENVWSVLWVATFGEQEIPKNLSHKTAFKNALPFLAQKNLKKFKKHDRMPQGFGKRYLAGVKMRKPDFGGADISEACLANTEIVGGIFSHASLKNTNFRGAILKDCFFFEVDATSANWVNAQILSSYFFHTNLSSGIFNKTTLENTCFVEAVVEKAQCVDAVLKDASFLEIKEFEIGFVVTIKHFLEMLGENQSKTANALLEAAVHVADFGNLDDDMIDLEKYPIKPVTLNWLRAKGALCRNSSMDDYQLIDSVK